MRPKAARIGYDPWLHTSDWVKQAQRGACRRAAPSWSRSTRNPIDAVWADRPAAVARRGWSSSPTQYAGKSSAEKRARNRPTGSPSRRPTRRCCRRSIRSPGRSTSAAQDVDPYAGRAGLRPGPCRRHRRPVRRVREDRRRRPPASRQRRAAARARRFRARCLGSSRARRSRSIRSASVAAIFEALEKAGAKIVAAARSRRPAQGDQESGRDRRPQGRAGARRRGARRASSTGSTIEAPKGEVDELTASDKLRGVPRARPASFATCRSTRSRAPAPNGAIVHYRVEREDQPQARDRARSIWSIRAANIRTARPTSPARSPIGEPTAEMRDRFTRVLKGHIALATRGLPQGHARQPARQLRAPVPVGGGPRLRPWHRPRRRQLPRRCMKGRSAFRRSAARRRRRRAAPGRA